MGLGAKSSPTVTPASGTSASPPTVNARPIVVSSSRPGTGREPTSVTVAKPVADRTARPAPGSADPAPDGTPTSRPRPASARQTVPSIHRSNRRRPVIRSTASTSTGDVPMVTSVARLTEVTATDAKKHAW